METNEQKLVRLCEENPELKILPCVDYDVCCDDTFKWWLGQINDISIKTRLFYEETYCGAEKVFFEEEDTEEIFEKLEENNKDWTEDQIQFLFDNIKREKVIALRIGLYERI